MYNVTIYTRVQNRNTWNPAFGKTIAMYLEDRAIQLYDYVIVRSSMGESSAIWTIPTY